MGANRRTGQAGKRAAGFARLTSLAVTLSLLVQFLFIPYHQALGAPAVAPSETTRVAAELKAIFGDAASLCIRDNGKGDPGTPSGQCDEGCPFCRFAAEASTLVVPEAPALVIAIDATVFRAEIPPQQRAPPGAPPTTQRARAPPATI